MSVFRKSFSLTVTLSLALSGLPMTSFAQSSSSIPAEAKKSRYAAKDTTFCDYKAVDMLKKVSDANSSKVDRLKELSEEVESVTSEMKIINTLGAFRDNYLQSLSAIKVSTTVDGKAKKEEEKLKNLNNLKKVIHNGLMLNVVGLLLKNGNLDKDDAFKVGSLCEIPTNKDQPVCQKGMFSTFLKNHPLDQMLVNLKQTYKNISIDKKPAVKEDIQKILSSIPSNISPEVIFKLLDRDAPQMTGIINSKLTEDNLKKCLNEKTSPEVLKSCEELLPEISTEKSDSNFVVKLNQKTSDAISTISGLSSIINEAARTNLNNLNKEITKHAELIQAPSAIEGQKLQQALADASTKLTEMGTQQSTKAQKQLNSGGKNKDIDPSMLSQQISAKHAQMALNDLGSARLFIREVNLASIYTPRQVEDIQKQQRLEAVKSLDTWKQRCTSPNNNDMEYCQEQYDIVKTNVENEIHNYKERLQSLQSEISKISVDENFRQNEVYKKYIAEKYLRSCTHPTISIKDETVGFAINIGGTCYGGLPQTLVSINSLGKDLNSVFTDTKFGKIIKDKSSGETTFDEQEMNEFNSSCKNNSSSDSSDVCSFIATENKVYVATSESIKKKVQAEKPIVEDDKNWVRYDGHGGYTKIAKKSTLRVVGEGMLPVLPQLIPMYFANYQTTQNIEMLTNQAIYQKQMLHTYDIYNSSPWMYNYNYFGGPAYGYGSPFASTGAAAGNTGVTNSTGFGF